MVFGQQMCNVTDKKCNNCEDFGCSDMGRNLKCVPEHMIDSYPFKCKGYNPKLCVDRSK